MSKDEGKTTEAESPSLNIGHSLFDIGYLTEFLTLKLRARHRPDIVCKKKPGGQPPGVMT